MVLVGKKESRPSVVSESLLSPRRPTPAGRTAATAEAGFSLCGMCRCCTCLHPGFIKTPTAAIKIFESIVSIVCQFLLIQFGFKYGKDLGFGYFMSLVTSSGCCLTSGVLLFSYVISANSYSRVRPSLFEVAFNFIACGFYISSSTLLAASVHFQLYYFYMTIPGFSAYPALTAVYVLGYIVGIVHGLDGCMAFKFMRST